MQRHAYQQKPTSCTTAESKWTDDRHGTSMSQADVAKAVPRYLTSSGSRARTARACAARRTPGPGLPQRVCCQAASAPRAPRCLHPSSQHCCAA